MTHIFTLTKLHNEIIVCPRLNNFVKLANIGMVKMLKNSYLLVQRHNLRLTLHLRLLINLECDDEP